MNDAVIPTDVKAREKGRREMRKREEFRRRKEELEKDERI